MVRTKPRSERGGQPIAPTTWADTRTNFRCGVTTTTEPLRSVNVVGFDTTTSCYERISAGSMAIVTS